MKHAIPWMALVVLALASPLAASPAETLSQADRISQAALDVSRAYAVEDLVLRLGPAEVRVKEGIFFAAGGEGDAALEFLFQGRATLEVTPPNEIERAQLELFSGSAVVSETIAQGSFVIGNDDARAVILAHAVRPEPDQVDIATEQFAAWRSGTERRILDADTMILMKVAGDPRSSDFLLASLAGDTLGRLTLAWSAEDEAGFVLGQFVPEDLTDKQERRYRKYLERQHRKGRLRNVDSGDLGTWNTWMYGEGPDALSGRTSAEWIPEHYTLDVTVDEFDKSLSGTARLRLRAVGAGLRVADLQLQANLAVTSVKLDGRELPFRRERSALLVPLPESPSSGESFELEVEFGGVILWRIVGKIYVLEDPYDWYPQIPGVHPATYRVVLHYHKSLDLMGSGKVEERQVQKGGMVREVRTFDRPSGNFSFEVGDLDITTVEVGHVTARIGFIRAPAGLSKTARRINQEIIDAVRESLAYYEEILGPYPLDHLEVLMLPREPSLAFNGFITLSVDMLRRWTPWTEYIGVTDRRTIVAHEVAHQWWGNSVFGDTYRDTWLNEALANYSAVLWSQHRFGKSRALASPISRWKPRLLRQIKGGRTIESLGPIVLGYRLESTYGYGAFPAIVYRKGAVVLNMLGHLCGTDAFLAALRKIAEAKAGMPLSTEEFLTRITGETSCELRGFDDRFVFGTGIPVVDYTYEVQPRGPDRWAVMGTARQRSSHGYRYALDELPDGTFDLRREPLARFRAGEAPLAVPFRLDVDKSVEKRRIKKAPTVEVSTDPFIEGQMILNTRVFDFSFEVDYRPKRLWLDYYEEVLGRFYDARFAPADAFYGQAGEARAEGLAENAEALYRKALESCADDDESAGPSQISPGTIRLALVDLYTDQRRFSEARRELAHIPHGGRAGARYQEDRLRAELRLDVLEHAPASAAYDRLKKLMGQQWKFRRGATYAWIAIAARKQSDSETFEQAAEAAEDEEIDLGLLRAAVSP